MSDESQPSSEAETTRFVLDYPDERSFVEGYAEKISRGGMIVPSDVARARGTMLRFQVVLADGTVLISGEGEVDWLGEDEAEQGERYGVGIRFTSLEPGSRALVDRATQKKAARKAKATRGAATEGGAADPPTHGRRSFLDKVLNVYRLGLLGAVAYPVIRYLTPLSGAAGEVGILTVGLVKEFMFNSSKIVRFGDKPIIVVRDGQGKFHALEALCTHLQCVVNFDKTTGQIHCGCHHAMFTLSGKNISGPAPRPLKAHMVRIVGDSIVLESSA